MDRQKVDLVGLDQEISAGEVVSFYKMCFDFLKKHFVVIAIVSIIGALGGGLYAQFERPKYLAKFTFVLEAESKGGLGQYAGLASLAGIDIGGGSGGGDIFQSDNIIELYKSRTMIEKTLLSESSFNGTKQKLIDRYIYFNHLRNRWNKKNELKDVNFNGDPTLFNRHQDSIISDIAFAFNKNYLKVSKPDRKLSIIEVDVTLEDEALAKEFANGIVANVNAFYIQTKTKKLLQNVHVLQKQADSVKTILTSSMYGAASATDASPNANPLVSILRVPTQRKQVDIQTSSAVYTEVLKNLELTKIQLRNETPLIQTVDSPVLPLKVVRLGKVSGILIGFFVGWFLVVVFLAFKERVKA